ncbi:MAG: FtsW/RodA/SpoVE family cell cycle protein, partial [Proteobacteria bacterium]|nr:FtsW/RodA/SpoVE family cell cycle protein [Pseudomonadota bacterium]
MTSFARTDTSVLGKWWWTVDRWLLVSLLLLMAAGVVFAMAASPPVAERIGLPSFHFVRRHLLFLPIALVLLFGFSLMPPLRVRRTAVVMFAIFFALTAATLVLAPEIKGSQRWLFLGGMALQPSEFLKPVFIVASAWMFAEQKRHPDFPGNSIAIGMCLAVIGVLVLQPDFGQSFLIFMVWGAQFFMAGLPLAWIALLAIAGVTTLIVAYSTLDHVASRVDRFLDPASGDTFQIEKAHEAFMAGGFLGRGPGEGLVKRQARCP